MSVFYRFTPRVSLLLVLSILLLATAFGGIQNAFAAPYNTIQVVDGYALDVGGFPSLALDANGNPVLSYYNYGTKDLKLAHCSDPICFNVAPATIPDTGDVGTGTSLALDAYGKPVISYYDLDNNALMLAVCNDPDCVAGGELITTIDDPGSYKFAGLYTSLKLDAFGNPVIAYYVGGLPDRDDGKDLMLARCQNIACREKSIQAVDTAGDVGAFLSLELDSQGNPVISYLDVTKGVLKLAHCGSLDCAPGTVSIQIVDDSIGTTTADIISGGDKAWYTSLELDVNGNPVISYYDALNEDLKLAHCDDPQCAPGGDSIQVVDREGDVGLSSSLTLDYEGDPVISYFDRTNGDLKLAYCGPDAYNSNPNCLSGNVSIETVDSAGLVGFYTSLALDMQGNPVIGYMDVTNLDLKLVRCGTYNCVEPIAYPNKP